MGQGVNKFVIIGLAVMVLAGSAMMAWHWYQREVAADYRDGIAAVQDDRYAEALALALPYADQHDPRFDFLLGQIYRDGPEGIQDIDRGLTYGRAAADAGNMRSAYHLGRWLIRKEATDDAVAEGLTYLKQAADCGMPIATTYYGGLLIDGDVVEQDLKSAQTYLLPAAWHGVVEAQYFLGLALALQSLKGGHKKAELEQLSMYWLMIAAKNDNDAAQQILDAAFENTPSEAFESTANDVFMGYQDSAKEIRAVLFWRDENTCSGSPDMFDLSVTLMLKARSLQ